ncbi:MAG: alpha/beta hydrolase [Bacteroidales bacterium]|nr:alpha/beta hydrolase [Bacteroidales bacterium]
MDRFIDIPVCRIRYRLSGSGPVLLLIHGYLESLDIWDDFAASLEPDYTVLQIDLPGHGQSLCKLESIGMDLMADCVSAVLSELSFNKVFFVGHSMGGYVGLAFAERYPDLLTGLCLFHSTPNADTAEKYSSRMGDIEAIRNGAKCDIVYLSIPRLFAESNMDRMDDRLDWLLGIALATSDEGIIGALNGMAQRPDRNAILDSTAFPSFLLMGRYDNLIPMSVVDSLVQKHNKTRVEVLNNSGHLGFIEERDQAITAIRSFLTQVLSCD